MATGYEKFLKLQQLVRDLKKEIQKFLIPHEFKEKLPNFMSFGRVIKIL